MIVGQDFSILAEAGDDVFASDVLTYIAYSGAKTTPQERLAIIEALRDDPRPLRFGVTRELIDRGLFPNDRRPIWGE